MASTIASLKSFYRENFILFYLALIKLLIHFLSNGFLNYGYFRDELYYIACSDHLAWGYVDQPPFSILMLAISRLLFGDSLFAIRLLPAVGGAATVFLTGLITKELGGGKFAQAMASVAMIAAPIYFGLNTFFSMNAFDIFFWAIGFYLIILIIKKNTTRNWTLLGIIIGVGLLNKISMFWFSGGLVVGLLITKHRKKFLSKGPWLVAVLACVIFLPHVIWQIANSFPTLEFMRVAASQKMASVPFMQFIVDQIMAMHFFNFPIWFAGLLYFLFNKKGSRFRLFGFMYAAIFLMLMLSKSSRTGYLAPCYSILLAGGSVFFENFARAAMRWLRPAYLVFVIAGGIITAPLVLPVLPVKSYIQYAKLLGQEPSTAEKKDVGKLGQFYADMHGWKEMVAVVARVYDRLTPEEKAKCAIITDNYGEAGAIDFFGREFGLPHAISWHNNYYIWGPGDVSGEVAISLLSRRFLEQIYDEVEEADTFYHEYVMPYENGPVYLCRGLRRPFQELWPLYKNFN